MEVSTRVWATSGKRGWGCKYWVWSGDLEEEGGGALWSYCRPQCTRAKSVLLTDWCLVIMMVGMGEISAWPITEPRI